MLFSKVCSSSVSVWYTWMEWCTWIKKFQDISFEHSTIRSRACNRFQGNSVFSCQSSHSWGRQYWPLTLGTATCPFMMDVLRQFQ